MEEKIYCTGNNDALAYAAMTNNNRNDAMNNPMWLIWAMLFGGGNGFLGGRGAGAVENAEINARLNSIERQAQDNHSNELLMEAMRGNHASTHELANNLNMSVQQLSERLNNISAGITKGFADIGFLTQQSKCEIVNAITSSQQRTADLLNGHWQLELSQKLQDTKAELSQERQTAFLISQLKPAATAAAAA